MMCALGLRLVGVLTLAGLTSACLVGPDYARPSAETPLDFKEAAGSPAPGWRLAQPSEAASRGDWWSVFRDPVLDGLIRAVDVDNQTLRQAVNRYEQARAAV
jgi:outer membrane protein TolC